MKSNSKKLSEDDLKLPWHELSKGRRAARIGVGLRRHVLVTLTSLVFAAVGVASVLFMDEARGRFSEALRSQAVSSAWSVASGAASPIIGNDLHKLHEIATNLQTKEPTVRVDFIDVDEVIIQSPGEQQDPLPPTAAKLSRTELGQARLIRIGEQDYYQAIAPVFTEGKNPFLVGYVSASVSTSTLLAMTDRAGEMMIVAAAIAVLMALPLSLLLTRSMTRPLREVVKTTKLVTQGDLDTYVVAPAGGVFTDLANAINELVGWVKQERTGAAEQVAGMSATVAELNAKIQARSEQLEMANTRLSGEIAEKEDFLRAVSHDLNAPLRNIGGMVQMLMLKNKETLPADVVQRLERINKNVEIETDLINELLDLSRIKSAKPKLERVETEAMIWDIRGMFENDLKTRQIELVIDSVLPVLFVEKARVRQVFQNLIDNAIKYMGDRPIREIHIGCRTEGGEAEFFVRDTGTGIHEDEVDKVFFIFRRGRSETTQKVAGKGVGLASVKSIVETYNGRIWVKSRLNEGTTFFFTVNGKYVPAMSGLATSDYEHMTQSDITRQAA